MGASDAENKQVYAPEARTPGYVFVGYLVSFLMGIVGGVVGGYAGWLLKEGVVTVGLAGFGFLLFFGVTCALSGPGVYHYGQLSSRLRAPDRDRVRELGHRNFHLYVTVHKVKDLYAAGAFGMLTALPTYVEVMVGRLTEGGKFSVQRNPATATCASASGVFEECFHFVVTPTDDTIRFVLRNRDIGANFFSEPVLGECSINITDEAVLQGFPQHSAFGLQRQHDAHDPGHHAGTLVISFNPGPDCELPAESHGVDRRLAQEHRQSTQGLLLSAAGRTGYGTWATGR